MTTDKKSTERAALAQEAQAVPREGRGYVTKDAIERAKRVMAAVDTYHARPDGGNRHALRSILMDEFEELLAAPQSVPAQPVAIPEGWQLVPKEPTQEMIDNTAFFGGIEHARVSYVAMLAAAPSAAEQDVSAQPVVCTYPRCSCAQACSNRSIAHTAPPAAEQDVPRALTNEEGWKLFNAAKDGNAAFSKELDSLKILTAAGAK